MSEWLMVLVMAAAFGVWLVAVPLIGRRATRKAEIRKAEIRAAKRRHPSGKDLNNGR